jgi:hypothetical protein
MRQNKNSTVGEMAVMSHRNGKQAFCNRPAANRVDTIMRVIGIPDEPTGKGETGNPLSVLLWL